MFIHVVRSGDTLYNLAELYDVPVERIILDNGLGNAKMLVVGQALIIRKENFVYTVKSGDTVWTIAERFGVSVESILKFNNLKENDVLHPGQELEIVFDNPEKVPMIINGYVYPEIDMATLRESLPHLTFVSIFSYQVKEDGTINNIDDEAIIREAYRHNVAPKMVVTNISRPGEFSSDLMHKIFSDPQTEDRLIANIIANLKKKGYYGVDFDFEYLYPTDKENYNAFLQKASKALHAQGYHMSSAIAPKTSADQPGLLYEAHDYKAHGQYDDHVIIMTYEWGYIMSEAMPVAPINLVEEVLKYAVTEIPPAKILMGVPNYGYDFNVPKIEGVPAKVITNSEAIDIARREGAVIEYNEEAQSPYFDYYDRNRKHHQVHFEDARSLQAKIRLALEYGLGGLSYWTLMSNFPPNWVLVEYYLDVVKVAV
jgi:spore germination protein